MLLFCSIFFRFVKISCYHSMGDTSNEYIMHLSGMQPAIRVLRVNWLVPFQWVLNRYGSNTFSPQKNMELNEIDLPRTIVIFSRFIPITSMYGVFTDIWLFIMVNTGKYTVQYMDPMVLWDLKWHPNAHFDQWEVYTNIIYDIGETNNVWASGMPWIMSISLFHHFCEKLLCDTSKNDLQL